MITSTSDFLSHKAKEMVRACDVRFVSNMLYVSLSDGREIGLPTDRIEWLSWLARATPGQRANWSIEPGGYAIYWEDLDDGFEIRRVLEIQPVV